MKKYLFLFALASLFQVRAEAVDAAKAKAYFNQLGYNEALKAVYGPNNYQVETLFTLDKDELNVNKLEEKQKLAVKFFHLGEVIEAEDKNNLFDDALAKEAYTWLESRKQITSFACPEDENTTCYKSTHSLYSVTLKNREVLYAFADYPEGYRKGVSPTAELSTTSMLTLWKLENSAAPKTLTGVAADFGSGVGILAHALLKLHPGLTMVYGLEIDEHSMRLSDLNADLNGLSNRYTTLNNLDPSRLSKALGGRKLSFAVSNPPFNIVPPALSKAFTNYGDGGCDGLNVTKIFIEQFSKNAAPNAKMVFYSQLAYDLINKKFILEKFLTGKTYSARYEPTHLKGLTFLDIKTYVSTLIRFVNSHGETNVSVVSAPLLESQLLACGVDMILPYFVEIVNAPKTSTPPKMQTGILTLTTEGPPPFMPNYGSAPSSSVGGGVIREKKEGEGGVIITLQKHRGGENITTDQHLKELYERRKKLLEQQKKQNP